MARTAVIAGSTGLVGSQLLDKLLAGNVYSHVTELVRRASTRKHPKLSSVMADFNDLSPLLPQLNADDAFCCLGTTQAAAGGRAGLERVDYHMVLEFARLAHRAGATRLFVVSSLGASLQSPSFYSRTKARMEAAVAEIGFDTVQIVRPSLLLGERSESRPLEALGQRVAPLLAPLLRGPLAAYRAIDAGDVADALLQLAADGSARGLQIHTLPL